MPARSYRLVTDMRGYPKILDMHQKILSKTLGPGISCSSTTAPHSCHVWNYRTDRRFRLLGLCSRPSHPKSLVGLPHVELLGIRAPRRSSSIVGHLAPTPRELRMKVLHLVQQPQRRGAEMFAFDLTSELLLRGFDVRTVYLYPAKGQCA